MKIGKQIIIVAIVTLVVGLSVGLGIGFLRPAPKELTPVKLTTGWVHAGGSSAPLFMGEDKGYFAEEGIKIDIVRGFGSADVISKVAAGTYEAGTGDLISLIELKASDPTLDEIAILVCYDANPNALTGIKGRANTPTTVKQIEGKKISAVAGSTAQILFPAYAKAAGIDATKVAFVTVARELVPMVVDKGEADLCTGFVSTSVNYFAGLGYKREDLIQFIYADYLPTLYGNVLVVRKTWAEKYPEAAKGLVRAYIRSLNYTYKHMNEAIDSLLKREPLLKRDIENQDLDIALNFYYFTKNVLKSGWGYQTLADMDQGIKLVADGLKLKRTPTADEIYTTKYLPSLEERLVK